ncbi:hypothetical protein YC2023_096247 [Brassica napus]
MSIGPFHQIKYLVIHTGLMPCAKEVGGFIYTFGFGLDISDFCLRYSLDISVLRSADLGPEPETRKSPTLLAISIAAEAKREEEKAKGVNPESGAENPDIVPFEDNEEEEEEEDESEEEEDGICFY